MVCVYKICECVCQKCAFLPLWDRKVGTKRIAVAMNANLAVLIIRLTFRMLINVFFEKRLMISEYFI